jgi:hypothetical protein
MKQNVRFRTMLVMIFVLFVVILGLIAIIFAMSLSISQLRKTLKEKESAIYALQNQVDSLTPQYTENQKKIIASLVGNPEIKNFIKRKPTLGGNWGVWSEKNITFIDENKVFVIYDDGHLMGAMVLKIKDPTKLKTWQVLWSTIF